MDERDDHAEILRLRTRFHALQKDVMGLAYRVDELEKLEPAINEVLLAKRVADGVAARIEENASNELGRWTKLGIAAGVLGGLGSFAFQILHVTGHG